jgi:integrase
MPYKRRDSPVWWVSYIDQRGKRIRRSTETEDRREAEALESKWKLEAYRAEHWGEQPSRTFEDLMCAWLRHAETTKRPNGFRRDQECTAHLRQAFGGLDLAQIGPARIRGYIDTRRAAGAKPATVNRELCVLSAAINHAGIELEWGDLRNPVRGRKLREPEGRLRWLTRPEAERLIEVAGREPQAAHLADFIRLAINTGCRRNELLGLEWVRVDFGSRLIWLAGANTKTATRRSIPINEEALKALRSRLAFRVATCPGSPWVFAHPNGDRIGDIKHGFKTACARAGIEDFRIHDLRHTCAAWMVQAGAALAEVRDVLGHSTIRMTERYAHLAPENTRAALARLDEAASRFSHAAQKEKVRNGG